MRPKKSRPNMLSRSSAKSKVSRATQAKQSSPFLWRVRGVFIWSLIGAVLIAALSLIADYEPGTSGTASLREKLPQAATLRLLNDDDDLTLLATGDILLARFVELKMRQLKDYVYPFRKVCDFLKSADITFGNLETPFFPGRNVPKESMTFRGDREGVQGLRECGFDVVSIANNHTMNYQVPGLTTTLQTLNEANILASGGGKNLDTAHTPALLSAKGRRIAIYSYVDPNIPPKYHGYAQPNKPGIARMDIEVVKNDVRNAKTSYGADIVIVSMHAGVEYKREPTQFQKDFAHAAIDAGASLVIGTHPHWVEPVEEYMDGVIFYSLGNFVFDQFFSWETQTGLIANITFDEDNQVSYEVIPVRIEKGQPRITEGQEREEVMKRLGL